MAELTRLLSHVQIQKLYIQGAQLSRQRLPFQDQENMTWLCVARTQFSNPAIDDLPLSLTFFDATRTRINDDGLERFTRLRNLKRLILRRTPTTEQGIQKLRDRMPWCRIRWESLVNR